MNTDQITERIYQKSDLELRKKLEGSVEWVWKEVGHSVTRPETLTDEVNKRLNGTGLTEFKSMPWIGAISRLFVEVSFAYLRDHYRNQAVHSFMEKVEAVQSILDEQQ